MISENLRKIEQEIQDSCALVSRSSEVVTLVAVTKSVGIEKTEEILEAGVLDCGENRVAPFLEKKHHFSTKSYPVRWHFIGNLQRRKVKLVINEIDYFHALDSFKLAQEIQKRAEQEIKCFVEVNISGEDSKHGFSPEAVLPFIEAISPFDKIKIVGLMTMAPLDSTVPQQHMIFKALKTLQEKIAALGLPYAPCQDLSMGMSQDYPIAVQEGATFVRVGTALFK